MCNSKGTLPPTATEMENELRQDTLTEPLLFEKGCIQSFVHDPLKFMLLQQASILFIHIHFIF